MTELEKALAQARQEGYDEGWFEAREFIEDNIMDYVGDGMIEEEIASGELDWEVERRALQLGFVTEPEKISVGLEVQQDLHRRLHPNGPWGWEYCSRCS